jgi:ABC-type multidrug transport system permease subunit
MRLFFRYTFLQVKKMFRSFPAVFFMTVFLAGGIVLLAWMQLRMGGDTVDDQKIRLGVVGDMDDSYLGFGITALQAMDSSRFELELVSCSEEEARKALEAGEISGYLRIPEGFVSSIVHGENKKVTYVLKGGQAGIGAALVQELSEAISTLVTESQSGIYSLRDFYERQGESESVSEDMDKLNLEYFSRILGRSNLYDIKILGDHQELSLIGYYGCSMLLCFLLFFGMNCGNLLITEDLALGKMLRSAGVGAFSQVIGEFLSYFAMFAANLAGIGAVAFAIMSVTGVQSPELAVGGNGTDLLIRTIPTLLLTAALQFFLYSLADSLSGGLLMQFLTMLALSYLSGCFYPAAYFPKGLRRLAEILPTGQALNDLLSLLGQGSATHTGSLLAAAAVLLLGAVLVRMRRWRA